jgi:aspartyl-tRNA(Asn)/glutamyl-tRNA(Gln) amidotransferase subunit B
VAESVVNRGSHERSSYEVVIGLEVHVQLLTRSKMFCGCSADYANDEPNTHVCPVCLGLPGSLPVINRDAVDFTIMTGLALNCQVGGLTRFDRKNYFYPDQMKNYQISQFDLPIARNGWLDVDIGDKSRRTGIRRVHLEEDTARLAHRTDAHGTRYSLVDVNRAGSALMEIVSEPDIFSPEQARAFLIKLRQILVYLGVTTGSMEEGSFRCDANVSIRPIGQAALGAKVEVKNMNSFRAVYRALGYEVERQAKALDAGKRIEQETRGWDDEHGVTLSQRSKESAHDYRYFPEPDLPPLVLTDERVTAVRARQPELPDARRSRFVVEYGVSEYDAGVLTASRQSADYFEAVVGSLGRREAAKSAANWLNNDLVGRLNAAGQSIEDTRIEPARLAELIKLVDEGIVSQRAAKEVFAEMFDSGRPPGEIVAARGLTQISDDSIIEAAVAEVLAANPKSVADYRAGRQQALGHLVGQVMRLTRGKANPGVVSQLLARKLAE